MLFRSGLGRGKTCRVPAGRMVRQVLAVASPSGDSPDMMVWTASNSGQFSLASAYSELRDCRPTSFLCRQAWHSNVPLKVSFFLLRLMRSHLPLDDVLASYGFHLPSRCSCCSSPQTESLGHLFLEGGLATTVWSFFGSRCGVGLNVGHVQGWLGNWWLKLVESDRLKFVLRLLPSLVCWHIWKARNKVVFQGARLNSTAACRAIFRDLKDAYGLKFIELQQVWDWPTFLELVEYRPVVFRMQLVRWHSPCLGLSSSI